MKTCIYTIARDESKHVEQWDACTREADFRFVLDTGSSDDTARLLRDRGIKTAAARPGQFRFDHARNLALSLLPDEPMVCVSLDMDEVISPGWRDTVLGGIGTLDGEPMFESGDVMYRVPDTGASFWANRVHLRHGARWVGACHEVLEPVHPDARVRISDVAITHLADGSKPRDYLPLLEIDEAERANSRTAFYLGREYFFHSRLNDATGALKKCLERSAWGEERSEACVLLSRICRRLGMPPEHGIKWAGKAVHESKDRREAWVELAVAYQEVGRLDLASDAARRALTITSRSASFMNDGEAWGGLAEKIAGAA